MKIKKLFELLALVDGVTSCKWRTVMEIVGHPASGMPGYLNNTGYKSNDAIVLNKQWHDDWKAKNPEYYPLNLTKLGTWSTFDNTCVDLFFTNKDNKLHCRARIYDGNNMHGYRTNLRFTAEFILPNKFIKVLEDNIKYEFERFLEEKHEVYLEEQKKNWIEDLRHKFLN